MICPTVITWVLVKLPHACGSSTSTHVITVKEESLWTCLLYKLPRQFAGLHEATDSGHTGQQHASFCQRMLRSADNGRWPCACITQRDELHSCPVHWGPYGPGNDCWRTRPYLMLCHLWLLTLCNPACTAASTSLTTTCAGSRSSLCAP